MIKFLRSRLLKESHIKKLWELLAKDGMRSPRRRRNLTISSTKRMLLGKYLEI
jgi:hypothetical protein